MRRLTLDFFKKLPAHEFRVTFSTMFTLVRIMLTPFVVSAMLTGHWGSAWVLFTVAAVTDVFDGWLARLLDQKTFLGTCLDPLADKFLLVSCFATLFCTQALPFPIPKAFLVLVLWRETFLVGGALCIYFFRGHIHIEPTKIGKATTFVQVLFITWLFGCYFFGWFPVRTYYTFLVTIAGLIAASFAQYAQKGMVQWSKS